jgi:hypothetical protein
MLQNSALLREEETSNEYHLFNENKNPNLVDSIASQLEEITCSLNNPALLPRNKNYFLEQINN